MLENLARTRQSAEKKPLSPLKFHMQLFLATVGLARTMLSETTIGLPRGYSGNRITRLETTRTRGYRTPGARISRNDLAFTVPDGAQAVATTSSGEKITVDDIGRSSTVTYTDQKGSRQSFGLNSRIRSARFGPTTFHREGSNVAEFTPSNR